MDIGKRIKELRLEKGLTQKELAQKLAISRSTLACYETNKNEISNHMLLAFAEFFDVSIDYLFDRKEL